MDNTAQPGWTLPVAFLFIYILAPCAVAIAYHFQHLLGPEEREHAREERENPDHDKEKHQG